MTTQEALLRCRSLVQEERRLSFQLEHCLPAGGPQGVRSQQYSAMPPGTNDPTAAALQLQDGLLARREELLRQIAALTALALTTLQGLPDARDRVLLTGYYLLGQTDQEIALAQQLSREHICRLRHEAFGAIKDL